MNKHLPLPGIGHNGAPPDAPGLTELRYLLFARGYKILPNRGKIPAVKNWNNTSYLTRELTDSDHPRGRTALEKIAYWSYRFPDAQSTGVRIEGGLRVIDIDVGDGPMVARLLGEIRRIAPDIADRAPMRFGSPHKVALFCRQPDHEEPKRLFNKNGELSYEWPTEFIRRASADYQRPGDAEDVTHKVEIFGGMPTSKGNCSRQFGIYGPHSYNDDGSVAREYGWADDRPALHEIDPVDLPVLSCKVAGEILAAFEQLALDAGWTALKPPSRSKLNASTLVYDIDENSRFNLNDGSVGVAYDDLYVSPLEEMRCSSSFIEGDRGTNTTKCWIFQSPRHNCIAVYNHETGDTHYPKKKSPDNIVAAFSAALRELIANLDAHQAAVEAREEADLERAIEIWKHCRPLHRTLAERYLRNCGIDTLPGSAREVLQFHEAYPWQGGQVPALVGMVADVTAGSGYPVGVQVTALAADGRKLGCEVIGQREHGAIMLSPNVTCELAIAVGFERALSAWACGIDIPMWALLDVEGLAEFPVLPRLPGATRFTRYLARIERLTIIADNDKNTACEEAIARTRARWEACGLKVRIGRPRQPGWNFADLLAARGRGK